MPTITVVLADQNKSSRAQIMDILKPEEGILVVGIARSGLEAITAAAKLKPDVMIINSNLFKEKRNNLLKGIRHKAPAIRVIVLFHRASEGAILGALSNGAQGCLQEGNVAAFLPKAVRRVYAGEPWVQRKMVDKIINHRTQLSEGGDGRRFWEVVLKYIGPRYN